MLTIADRAADYIRRFLLLAVCSSLSACGGRHSAAPTTTATTDHTDAGTRSQTVLNDAIEARAPGCSAAVGVKGKVVWTGVRGVADMSTGKAITTQTVFDIASVSKQFTATGLLLLVDGGKLTLNDPLSRYMPEMPTWATTVTVGQLMHQTSGIPEYVGLLEAHGYQLSDRTTEDQALQALVAVPKLEFQPGSQFDYSNSNYLLLGEIVRRVAREPLPQFLTEQIFQPLGLGHGRGSNRADSRQSRLLREGQRRIPGDRVGLGGKSATAASRPRQAN